MGVDGIHETAERILARDPDPVVRFRLLRDVLRRPIEDHELMQARQNLAHSRWVQELEREQRDDGSWGRLHSKDYSANQKIPTTEAGVERALALGLDAAHHVMRKTARHLAAILDGKIQPRDRPEKNDRWPTGVQLFAASILAQIAPDHPTLDDVWDLWANIARCTFASGSYDPEAEIRAHRVLTGATVKNSYLVIDNKYALTLLSSRPADLPRDVETALLSWVWHKEDGIRYLAEPVQHPPRHHKVGRLDRWFLSLELLSRFPAWRTLAGDVIQWLWDERTPDGLWDFGPRPAYSVALPLSESWRKRAVRQFDWTTRVLVLLMKYYSSQHGDGRICRAVTNLASPCYEAASRERD